MQNGSINLILGPMFSGKTSELINRYNKYTIGGKKCLMVKYRGDVRYDTEKIVSHNNISVKAVVCELLHEIESYVTNVDVICIDEIQFYKDAHIFCDKWANQGKIIEACGLNGNFERKPFEVISKLIPQMESCLFLKAVCRVNGNDASFTKRLNNKTEEEIIGGSEMYSAVDRKNYFTGTEDIDIRNKLTEHINLMHSLGKIDEYKKTELLNNLVR